MRTVDVIERCLGRIRGKLQLIIRIEYKCFCHRREVGNQAGEPGTLRYALGRG